jgi:hypothetical protein
MKVFFKAREFATTLICERNGGAKCTIRGTWYQGRCALLTPGSSDGLKNAPIAFSKKTCCFFAQKV